MTVAPHDIPMRRAAFSLLEVLLAVVLLGMTIVALSEALASGLNASRVAERHSLAVQLASNQLDLLRTDHFISEGEDEGEFEQFPGYSWTQKVETTDYEGLYRIHVAIHYKSPQAAAQEVDDDIESDETAATSDSSEGSGESSGATAATKSRPLFQLETYLFDSTLTVGAEPPPYDPALDEDRGIDGF